MNTLELPMCEFDMVAGCCSIRPWLTFQSARCEHLGLSTQNEPLFFSAVQLMMHNLLWVFDSSLMSSVAVEEVSCEKLELATTIAVAFNIGFWTKIQEWIGLLRSV